MTDVRARTTTGARNGLRFLGYGFALLLALLTASCGNDIFQVGTPVITLSAKPGRFTSYAVTIDEITLTRKDGTVIELPTIAEQVDLANLRAYTNVLEAPAVEIGTYVSATFILDFVSPVAAKVTVDYGGGSYQTTLFDPDAKAASTTQTVQVNFDPNHPFVINDQQSSVLAIDIDLEASNIVGAADSNQVSQVTTKPFWNVTAQPSYDKQTYVRGLYVLADTKNNNFVMNTRPLHDILNQPFGAMKVNVDDNTYWNVNGVIYTGAAGLATLSALTNELPNLQIAAYGPPSGNPFADLSTITPTFTATQVYVGSGFESTLEDQVTGVVAAVSGNTVTLQNGAFVDRIGGYGFTQTLPISVSANTIVTVDGMATPASLSSLSVGQVITALGLGDQPTLTNYNPGSFDASGSVIPGALIRIQNTPLVAQFNSAKSASEALVNVALVNGVEPLPFLDFSGTGNPPADPTNYDVTTPSDLSATAPGTWLNINGITSALGQGPPFFTAASVSTDVQQQLILEWTGNSASNPFGSATPFTAVTSGSISVNLSDSVLAGGSATVRAATSVVAPGTAINLLTNPPSSQTPTVLQIAYDTQNAQHPPLFGVGSVSLGEYVDTDPTSFVSHVNTIVNNTNLVQKLVAYGHYDPTTGIFSATNLTINSQ